jgi:hypothetical protein
MREFGPASSDEMVLAFLRAEIDSPAYETRTTEALKQIGADRSSLIDNADLKDANANRARAIALGLTRGYGCNMYLFEGFPTDTTWRRVQIDPSEFQKLKYVNTRAFWQLTDGTRSVEVGARNYRRDVGLAPRVDDIVQTIESGGSVPELILVEHADRLVVLEGNTRATAYVRAATAPISAVVGSFSNNAPMVFLLDM